MVLLDASSTIVLSIGSSFGKLQLVKLFRKFFTLAVIVLEFSALLFIFSLSKKFELDWVLLFLLPNLVLKSECDFDF